MIPNNFHFIFFTNNNTGKTFSFSHYLCIKSAIIVNKPDKVFFYYNELPKNNKYFEELKGSLSLVKVNLPEAIYGHTLSKFAHKADILRLVVLKLYGGIYMDVDVICKKSLSVFLNESFVLGAEMSNTGSVSGLCNGVMLSEPNSTFIQKWLQVYQLFRYRIPEGSDEKSQWWQYWAEHSVQLPMLLASLYPKEIKIVPYNFFHYPNSNEDGLKNLFVRNIKYESSYCHHLWETMAWDSHLKNLSEKDILQNDTTVNVIARDILKAKLVQSKKDVSQTKMEAQMSDEINKMLDELAEPTSISYYYSNIVLKELDQLRPISQSIKNDLINDDASNAELVRIMREELVEIYSSRSWKMVMFQKNLFNRAKRLFKSK